MEHIPIMKGQAGLKTNIIIWLIATPLVFWALSLTLRGDDPSKLIIISLALTYTSILWSLVKAVPDLYKGLTHQFNLILIENEKFQIIDGKDKVFEGEVCDLYAFDTDQCGIFIYPTKDVEYRLLRKDIPEDFPLKFGSANH